MEPHRLVASMRHQKRRAIGSQKPQAAQLGVHALSNLAQPPVARGSEVACDPRAGC